MVCTDPYIPLLVFINLAHTVVSKRSRRVVLLIPYHILIFRSCTLHAHSLCIVNQAVGSAHPPVTAAGLKDSMQTVALAREGNLIERSEAIVGMGR